MIKTACWVLLVGIAMGTVGNQDDDEVFDLPGYAHRVFSGYLEINSITGKSIHYVFLHSQDNPTKDPLVLWLTGGPGCSSLLATFQENGPFTFQRGASAFSANPESWNNHANLLYFELPAGVGFSEPAAASENITDELTSNEALSALRLFFARFPETKDNEFYLTGHGYSAVFVAYLARQIIEANESPFVIYYDDIKLKGVLVGNPCMLRDECYATDISKHSAYHYEFLHKRAFISRKDYQDFLSACSFNYESDYDCFVKRMDLDAKFDAVNTSVYNLYDHCYKGANDTVQLGLPQYVNTGCEDLSGLTNYLNLPATKAQWNVRADREWSACNMTLFKHYSNDQNAYFLLPYLLSKRLRLWVYSGDLDSSVSIVGTKKWVSDLRNELNMPQKKVWRQWWVPGHKKAEDQIGGYIWELRDFTLVTVRGAGFRSGYDQPKAMSEILDAFLKDKTLPYRT